MYTWNWTDKTVAVATENIGARFKYIKYKLPEPQNTRTDGIITSYEYANILTILLLSQIIKRKTVCLW